VWLFPIHFKSNIKNDIIIDENKLKLRRITEDEILQFFKVKIKERTENGMIKITTDGTHIDLFTDPLSAILVNHRFFVMSSQFILEAEEIECVRWFQQALKLYKDGKTGAFWGVNSQGHSINFILPIPFYGKEVYSLEESDVPKIKELYKTIKSNREKRYDLMKEKFLFALSGEHINNENRFLELATILEMLYSPKSDRIELSFRLSLRVCKVLSKYESLDEETTFEDMREIYKIRSGISHSGSHKETAAYLDKLIDYTRKSLVLFLKDPSIFEEEKLDQLCIKNWTLSK
jgi:hypothetical protein